MSGARVFPQLADWLTTPLPPPPHPDGWTTVQLADRLAAWRAATGKPPLSPVTLRAHIHKAARLGLLVGKRPAGEGWVWLPVGWAG